MLSLHSAKQRGVLIAAIVLTCVTAWQMRVPAQTTSTLIYGVTTSNRLIAFNSSSPGALIGSAAIANLAAGENIVGLDMRPATNQLYAVSSTSQLYVIDQRTATATRVGAPLSPALSGTQFGFDFNPTVDRIRIVSNTGQNLRVHPDTTAVTVDAPLVYAAGDANAGRTPRIVGAAYTSPDNDASTGTTLFDIDATLAIGATQAPPNDGVLNTFGALGGAVGESLGFDISLTDIFVAATTPGGASSSLISFTGGLRRDLGTIAGGEIVHSIAVSLGAPFVATAERVYAVTTANELVTFASNAPGTLLGRGPITNLGAGERIVGIDFRPANNYLYALGSGGQLYTINAQTAVATRVGPTFALSGTEFGFDFNPTVDRIRIVSDSGQNLRVNPDTAAVIVDGNLAFAPSDANAGRTPRVTGAAYTSPDNNPSTGTMLFVFDSGLDIGAIQDPPNNGTLNTFAALGTDAGDVVGFDFSLSQALIAFIPVNTSQTVLLDVANGQRRTLGAVGGGLAIRGLAVSLGR